MLSSSPISPLVYNALPSIDDTVAIFDATLQAVGPFFAAFNVEHLVKALANHVETHQLSGKGALSKLDTKEAMGTSNYDSEKMSSPRNTHDHKLATHHSKFLVGSELTSQKPEPGRRLYMEHVDTATSSQIFEEAPKTLPAEATQWIFEGGVPFITHGCARTNRGEGEYIHKQKARQRCSCFQHMTVNSFLSSVQRTASRQMYAIDVDPALISLSQRSRAEGVIWDRD